MDGPPPDPRMVSLPTGLTDDPVGHAICVALAVVLLVSCWRLKSVPIKAAMFIVATVIGFTSPWLTWTTRAWFGAFPTIDKEGSLLFFLDGVHRQLYLDPLSAPTDDAVRLIGVHAGHLWVTELFASLIGPMAAFNAQWLVQIVLAWGAAAWAVTVLCREPGGTAVRLPPAAAVAAAFPFGMGLHVFRDLDITTVEKGGLAFVPLFAVCWVNTVRHRGRWRLLLGASYLGMALYNLYFAVVCAAFGGLYAAAELLRRDGGRWRATAEAVAVCAAVGVPIALAQLAIQAGGPAIATPDQFLWERAGLDGFTLSPLEWNRIELWRACNPVALGLAVVGAWSIRGERRFWRAMFIGAGLFVLSLGPVLVPGETPQAPLITNPFFLVLHEWVPGFWRLAKPEVFFQPVWLLLLTGSGLGLRHIYGTRRPAAVFVGLLVFVVWWPIARLDHQFPGMSAPLDSSLDPGWTERVFGPAIPGAELPAAPSEQHDVAPR